MKIYIDLDSGTVLNGPVYVIEGCTEIDVELMCESDDVARDWAVTHGRIVN